MTERRTIDIYFLMDESGAFAVADDPIWLRSGQKKSWGKMQT
jgi:hypothetical protein